MWERLRQLASLVVLLGVWSAIAFAVGQDVLPGPYHVARVLGPLIASGDFAGPLGSSLLRVVLGFLLGFALGVIYGILAARSRVFARITTTTTLILLFAPTLVIIFVGILLLGTNNLSAVVITGLITFPPLGVYIRDVLADVDEELLSMADSFKVDWRGRVSGIYLPYLVPPLLSAVRTGFTHSWKIVFLTEVFGLPGGLGFQVRQDYDIFNLQGVISWLVIFIIVMLIIEQLIRAVEHRFVRWQA